MMNISHIASALIAVASAVGAVSAVAQTNNIPGVGTVVKPNMAAGCPGAPGCPTPLVDERAAPKKMAAFAGKFVDINRASQAELAQIPSLGKAGADLLILLLKKGPFRDAADLARRACPQSALNLEETSIQIGQQQIVYRGGNPKDAGWRCGTAAGTYSINYKVYKY